MSLNPSKIDYLAQAKDAINRPGYTLNIVTGCKHGCEYCYARQMVERGRLKGHPSYPYGFEPTFHPERIRAYGGKPKLIFLNDMGDCGGAWKWFNYEEKILTGTRGIANEMRRFALLNPQHIILLLTKNPSWYRYATWPPNVWCGFTATNNEELIQRWNITKRTKITFPASRSWVSLEPWLDENPPLERITQFINWLVLGGLSGPNARPVSQETINWLADDKVQATRFTKENALVDVYNACFPLPREYPDTWRVK